MRVTNVMVVMVSMVTEPVVVFCLVRVLTKTQLATKTAGV